MKIKWSANDIISMMYTMEMDETHENALITSCLNQ